MPETIDYVKKNMGGFELAGRLLVSAFFALLTTAPIIGAFLLTWRVLVYIPLWNRVLVAAFVAVALVAMILFVRSQIGMSDLHEWVSTDKIHREELGIYTFLSWVVAALVLTVFMVLRDVFWLILSLTPISVLPVAAFLYMLRNQHSGWRLGVWGLIYGYGFGALLEVAGFALVLAVDVIGWELTALAVVCEILISALYLYNDLTKWVREDVERNTSRQEREERAEELSLLADVARRVRPQ